MPQNRGMAQTLPADPILPGGTRRSLARTDATARGFVFIRRLVRPRGAFAD